MSVNSDQATCEYNHVDEEPHSREENDHRPVLDEDPAKLKFDEVPESKEERDKVKQIEYALEMHSATEDKKSMLKMWQNFAISKYGLVNDEIRRKVWPLLLNITYNLSDETPSLWTYESHPEFKQVQLDVERSLKRFPPGIPYNKRIALQDRLTALIMRIIVGHPYLNYYQGYHDVAITFLLVIGDLTVFPIVEKLSTHHFRECMDVSLDKTVEQLQSILPLLFYENRDLGEFMEMAEIGIAYALPWFLTWFGHSLNQYRDVVRLYDYFLAKPKLASLYVCASLVLERADDILQLDCDMPTVHNFLSKIPDQLDFEAILERASIMYTKYPPEMVKKDLVNRAYRNRKSSPPSKVQLWSIRNENRNRRYTMLLAAASFAVGLYAFFNRTDLSSTLLFFHE